MHDEHDMLLQADSVRDYMRETAPLGAALTSTSAEEPTPEEEEEEEEEGEDEDEGTGLLLATIMHVAHQYAHAKPCSAASDGQDDEQEDTDDGDDTLDASI